MLASCPHEISTALDYLTTRPEVDANRIGFLGHSYIQAEFVLPGFAATHDLEDVIACFDRTALLISAGTADKWSRGAEELFTTVEQTLSHGAELALYDAGHVFTAAMRERAYQFLSERC